MKNRKKHQNQAILKDAMVDATEVRSARANRGNNLLKLIRQEKDLIDQNDNSTAVNNEDVIQLLFQEEEDDEDMEVNNDELNSNDDKFSETDSYSEDESSDYEESDDEISRKRKSKQQIKNKSSLKKNKYVPILVKRKTKPSGSKKEKPAAESYQNFDLLNTDNRRTSTRKSALENRLKVHQSLKEKEANRIKNFEKHNIWKSKKVEVELTQEDRMEQALETEKINTASLQRFREVEIYQKLQREEQQLRKKIKFKNFEKILRFSSEESLVTPEDDLKLYELQTQYIIKRLNRGAKKKYLEEEKKRKQTIQQLLGSDPGQTNVDETPTNELKDGSGDEAEVINELPLEGPSNKVTRNFLSLYYFNSTEKVTSQELKAHFNFNKPSEDLSDIERIIHFKKRENNGPFFEPIQQAKASQNEIQLTMNKFMKFGDFDHFRKSESIVDKDSTNRHEKKTLKYILVPSLFYKSINDSSSNIKKNCYLKTNEKVKYIDPKLNIAYSDLEVYKILNSMVQNEGGFKWVSVNDAKGMYVCENTTPAEGVPPGFAM